MWRINNDSGRIINIFRGQETIDGFLIIPGVTQFSSITIRENKLQFNSAEWVDTITIHFSNVSELERFLNGFMRDFKIDSILRPDKK